MYPKLNQSNKYPPMRQSLSNPKKNYFTKEIEDSIMQLRTKFNVTSVKSFLSSYEAFLNLAVPKGAVNQIPLKIVFYQKYPTDRPIIYVTKTINSPIINQLNGQVKYQDFFKWTAKTKILQLINKIHAYFTNNGAVQDGIALYIENYKKGLQQYSKQITKLTQSPLPNNLKQPFSISQLNIPQIPQFDFTFALKQKQNQQRLFNNCENSNQLYITLIDDYKVTQSKAQYISERFGKGKILKQMQKAMQAEEVQQQNIGEVETLLIQFQKKRKNYHRLQILKQKYLQT